MDTNRRNSRADVEHYDLEILLRRPSLRTNISRRTSQVPRGTVKTEETTCGFGCVRNEWLQSFANRRTFIFIYGVLGSFYGSYYAYFYGTITTLERQFKLSSLTIGMIATVSDISQITMCLILSACMPKAHKAKLIGFGMYIIIVSTIISALPHFLYGPSDEMIYKIQENVTYQDNALEFADKSEVFSDSQQCAYNRTEENTPVILLVLAQILHGIGGSFYSVLGKKYKEENIDIHQTPALITLLNTLKTLGPAFGYWLSSVCLKIFVLPTVKPVMNENDPNWIGAWWLGNLIIGFMLVIPASSVLLFPNMLPKTAVRRIFGERRQASDKANSVITKDKISTFKRHFLYSTFSCESYAGLFSTIGFTSYFIFLPKYVETQYQITPSSANLITGSVTLIFSSFGIVVLGSVITRYRPKAKILAVWNVCVGLLSISSLVAYIYLGCHENDEQVNKMVLQWSSESKLCGNGNTQFTPVCDELGQTFISLCHMSYKNDHYLNNKKMLLNDTNQNLLSSDKSIAVSQGICPVDCHFNFIIFTIVTCSMIFLYASGRASNFWFEVKYNETYHKPSQLLSVVALFHFIAFIPSPIIFGYILDKSCLSWKYICNNTGNCLLYDNENLRHFMNYAAIGFVLINIIFDLGILVFVKNLKLFEKDEQYIDEMTTNKF